MFEEAEAVGMEDDQDCHHLRIRQSAGLVAVRSAVLELACPEFLVENFAEIISKTEKYSIICSYSIHKILR